MSRTFAIALVAASIGGAIASSGCAPARATIAEPSDWASYRRYRLADTRGDRLASAWAYLKAHPEGAFRAEVDRWFSRAEPRWFAKYGHTPSGASSYLAILPDGPHAADARTFLRAWEIEQVEAPLRARRALEAAKRDAESARRAFATAIETWTKSAVEAHLALVEPQERLDQTGFGAALRGALSEPCGPSGCSAVESFAWTVAEEDPPRGARARLEIHLERWSGVPIAIELRLGAGGFLGWAESAEGAEAAESSAEPRAKNRVESIVRAAAGGACEVRDRPLARVLRCGELEVTVATLDGQDLVRIERALP